MRHPLVEKFAACAVVVTGAANVIDWIVRALDIYSGDWPGLWEWAFAAVAWAIAHMNVDAIVMAVSAVAFVWARYGGNSSPEPSRATAPALPGSQGAAPGLVEKNPGLLARPEQPKLADLASKVAALEEHNRRKDSRISDLEDLKRKIEPRCWLWRKTRSREIGRATLHVREPR
jgi:hypothetical protein